MMQHLVRIGDRLLSELGQYLMINNPNLTPISLKIIYAAFMTLFVVEIILVSEYRHRRREGFYCWQCREWMPPGPVFGDDRAEYLGHGCPRCDVLPANGGSMTEYHGPFVVTGRRGLGSLEPGTVVPAGMKTTWVNGVEFITDALGPSPARRALEELVRSH